MRPEAVVYRILLRAQLAGERLTAAEIAQRYCDMTGRPITTAALTARVRDLRAELGEERLPHSRRENGAYRYALQATAMDAARNRNENGPTAGA